MPPLPEMIITLLVPFAPLFTRPGLGPCANIVDRRATASWAVYGGSGDASDGAGRGEAL
jgi:hypothetical protein